MTEESLHVEEVYVHPHLSSLTLGPVRVLRIDREDKLGALSTELINALTRQIEALEADAETRVLVLTGTGRGFIAGADIEEYANFTDSQFQEYQRYSRALFDRIARLRQIVIAAVDGYAFGGGFEITLCCDFIVASESARFGLPEVKLGLIPGGGGLTRLSRLTSPSFAKDVILTGRTIYPPEAAERGIITRLVDDKTAFDAAIDWAQQLASGAPLAQIAAKDLLNRDTFGPKPSPDDDLNSLVELHKSQDGREGVAAFVEKREPVFHGA